MIIFILIAIFLVFIYTLSERLGKLNQSMNDQNMLYQNNKFMERKQGTSIKPKTKRSASGSNWETYKDIIYKEESNRDKKKNNNSTTEFSTKFQKYRKSNQGNAMNNIVKCDSDMAENKKKLTKLIAMDCEMVGIGDGRESMVARVSIVNKFGHCLYDKYVKPRERIKDYRTAVSGIYPHHLKSGEDFATVQKEVAEILKGRILVGHALKHDLAVLFLSHPCRSLRDTSRYKLFKDIIKSKTPSLKRLALELLGIEIQIGEHDSVEDARVAMQLYMLYRNRWESEIYSKRMKFAIIGAGSAGLAALRHFTSDNYKDEVVCYEKTEEIGGTWVYREETGLDRYNLPIHTSMYKSLRTNLPKEVMGFPDFPIPDRTESYLTRTEILHFLNSYCDYFKLRRYIRFLHNVEYVKPISGDRKWSIKVKDLKNNIVENETFDAIMVCNGHYFEPFIPNLKGKDIFQGNQLHSHDYRIPTIFNDKTVVIIGAGPSGMDLALEISTKAKRVILSHHLKDTILTKFPDNVVQKTDVVELTEHDAVFKNGSKEIVDVIFYCTGYKYSFPFLSEKCGIRVDSNMVTPLWKHLVSIENPTLAIVGLPFYVCAFSMFDLQVRFLQRFWHGEKTFPEKTKMLEEESKELEKRIQNGLNKKHFHMMGVDQGQYYDDLANTAGIVPLPPVLTKLHNESSKRFLDDLVHYREDRYKIIDDYNFVQL